MHIVNKLRQQINSSIEKLFKVEKQLFDSIVLDINTDKNESFGDLSSNAALILAKILKKNPQQVALQIKDDLLKEETATGNVEKIEIAGAGFLNFHLSTKAWSSIASNLLLEGNKQFALRDEKKKKYLIEFVSANPTGPLHLGAGRNGIIGDVLANILKFLGHSVTKEFYINDAGAQIIKLGQSLKARVLNQLGKPLAIPEGGYAGEYLSELAKKLLNEHGEIAVERDDSFFASYAKEEMLKNIKRDLASYRINFDSWFAESTLYKDGSVDKAIELLRSKELVYEQDEALWFKSTQFGDDKDRVIKKKDGSYTYIAGDIAYHKNKFDRGFDRLIDVLGQDHHGYLTRLKATMEALDFDPNRLDIVVYQLVSIKKSEQVLKMSKRKGAFTTLHEIIDTVGADVARFFYLNRKPEAHLEFDLDTALKKTEENPAYYIQYAYVRGASLFRNARAVAELGSFLDKVGQANIDEILDNLNSYEVALLRKIISLEPLLLTIERSFGTHLIAYYTHELAKQFHTFYANNRIINSDDLKTTKKRLLLTLLLRQTIALCLDLLGISKPSEM